MRVSPCVTHPCALQFVDMEGWTLLSSDRQVVPHELQAEAALLRADLRPVPEAFPELYWQAPPSYLGDRVSSRPSGPWAGTSRLTRPPREAWGRQGGGWCPGRGGLRAGAQPPAPGVPGRVWPGLIPLTGL